MVPAPDTREIFRNYLAARCAGFMWGVGGVFDTGPGNYPRSPPISGNNAQAPVSRASAPTLTVIFISDIGPIMGL